MRIVNIIGGLGNQMFQYAFAMRLKEQFPEEEVLIDTSHFNYIFLKKYKSSNLHNGYEIEKVFPNATLQKAKIYQLSKVSLYIPNYWLGRILRKIFPKRKTEIVQPVAKNFEYMPELFEQKGDYYYEGIWESIRNYLPIRDKLLHTFQHPAPNKVNTRYIDEMQNNDSVGIHIRRGDYIYHPAFRDICDIEYFTHAIAEIQKDEKSHIYYLFTNDTQWCQEHICPLFKDDRVVIVRENTGKNSCWDLFLMTYCKDLIIANSSFSWWAAFLNNRKGRIIAPKRWANRNTQFDIWHPDWIRL